MFNPAILKLFRYNELSDGAVTDLEAALSRRIKMRRGAEIVLDADAGAPVWVLMEGWACRYMMLPNGERQIVGLMTAGDFCDTRTIRLAVSNCHTMAMSDAVIAAVAGRRFNEVLDRHRDVVLALAKSRLADESIMQTWIANMARKTARQRMAHLLCEMVSRVSRFSDTLNMLIKLPFIQLDFADILGLSSVHVNRVLQALRADRLISFEGQWLEIKDYKALAREAEFDPTYLYYNESKLDALCA